MVATAWVPARKNTDLAGLVLNNMALEVIAIWDQRSDFVSCRKNAKPYYHNLLDCIENAANRVDLQLAQRKNGIFLGTHGLSPMLKNGTDVEKLREMVNWKTA